ncbi:hypothetical protein IHE45_14G140900 [Dioscorea alata]|uniref:Uncharacterized protein n=1 Tax=Dioscorea alata TaxID=55571 RepID=A0ACB7UVR9_DIOAL|nr:hypothetical protein IHE45_14G140900 [Dioscorea alata]
MEFFLVMNSKNFERLATNKMSRTFSEFGQEFFYLYGML